MSAYFLTRKTVTLDYLMGKPYIKIHSLLIGPITVKSQLESFNIVLVLYSDPLPALNERFNMSLFHILP